MKAFALVMMFFLQAAGLAIKAAEFVLELCRESLRHFTLHIYKRL